MQPHFPPPYTNRLLALEASLHPMTSPSLPLAPSRPSAPAPKRSYRQLFRRSAPPCPPPPVPPARQQRNRFLALEEQLSSLPDRHQSAPLTPLPPPNLAETEPMFSYRTLNQRLTERTNPNVRSFRTPATAAFAKLRSESHALPQPELPPSRLPLPPLPEPVAPQVAPTPQAIAKQEIIRSERWGACLDTNRQQSIDAEKFPNASVAGMAFSYRALERKLPPRSPSPSADPALDLPELILDSEEPALQEQHCIEDAALSSSLIAEPVHPKLPLAARQSPQPELLTSNRLEPEVSFSYSALAIALQQRKDTANGIEVNEVNIVAVDGLEGAVGSQTEMKPDAPSEASLEVDSEVASLEVEVIALATLPPVETPDSCQLEASRATVPLPEVVAVSAIVPSTPEACLTALFLDQGATIDVTFAAVTAAEAVKAPIIQSQGFSPNKSSHRARQQRRKPGLIPGVSSAKALQRRLGTHTKTKTTH